MTALHKSIQKRATKVTIEKHHLQVDSSIRDRWMGRGWGGFYLGVLQARSGCSR